MIYLIIYLIGIVISYIIWRISDGPSEIWEEVIKNFIFSTFWPFILISFISFLIVKTKPPKWL